MIEAFLQISDIVLNTTEVIDGTTAAFTGVMAYIILKTYKKTFPSAIVEQINGLKIEQENVKTALAVVKIETEKRFTDGEIRFAKINGKLDVISTKAENINGIVKTIQEDVREIREKRG